MVQENTIIVREVTIDDLKITKDVVIVVNSAYRTDAGWTSENDIVHGDRVADEEIETSVRGHGTTCRLLYAFDVSEGYEKVVGTLRIDPVENDERAGEIRLFSVAPSYQSRGVGGRLVRFAMARMEELGYGSIVMRVFETRVELINWYKKIGFTETGAKIEFHDQSQLKVKGSSFITLQKLLVRKVPQP